MKREDIEIELNRTNYGSLLSIGEYKGKTVYNVISNSKGIGGVPIIYLDNNGEFENIPFPECMEIITEMKGV